LTKVEIDAPDLPGGVRAQARIDIAQSTDAVDNIGIESAGAGYTQQSDPSGFVVFDTITIDSSSVGAGLKVKCRVDKSGKITYAAPQDGGSGYIDGERVRVLDDPNVVITEACILVVRLVEGKNGQIYRAVLTDPGSGYAKVPGVTFIDETKNEKLVPAEAIVRTRPGRKSVNMGVTVSDNATLPTTFRFDAPVYLLGDAKYAFVVKCPTSIDYELYCAKIGQKIIGTETKVVAQPNTGSLFTSQKAGNWTEDSSTDLTFVLRRANFKSNFTSNLKLVNEPVGLRLLPPDPIEVCRTLSLFPPRQSNPNSDNWEENDKIVKVYHPNHGLRAGDMVALEGIDGGSSRTIGGINVDNLNTLHQVISADMDYFTIKVIQGATSSLKAGGNRIMGSYNRPYETINLYSGVQTFPSSTLFATNIATEAAGVTQYNNDKQYRQSVVEDIPIMDSFYYDGAKQVANYLNEAKYSQSDLLDGRRSLETNITFSSSDSRVSPVIDLERTSMNVISNLINKPEPNEVALINRMRAAITGPKNNPFTADIAKGTPIDFRLKSGKVVTLIVESVIPELNKMIVVGAGADEVTNFDNVESVNMPSFDMDDLLSLGEITISNNIEYLSEEFNDGTSYSKWFSKQFVLENISDAISVRMSAIFYENTDIRLYFRPRFVGFDGDTGKINWMPFNGNAVAPNEQRVDAEGKPIKTPGLPDNIETLIPRSSRNVDSRSIRSDEWQELIWSIQDIAQFDAISLKIVMEASNPAKCPIIDDLRVVVSE